MFGKAKARSGPLGVPDYFAASYGVGSITYVANGYAQQSGFPVVNLLNAAGYFVLPTPNAVSIALLGARIAGALTPPGYRSPILDGVYGNPDPRSCRTGR